MGESHFMPSKPLKMTDSQRIVTVENTEFTYSICLLDDISIIMQIYMYVMIEHNTYVHHVFVYDYLYQNTIWIHTCIHEPTLPTLPIFWTCKSVATKISTRKTNPHSKPILRKVFGTGQPLPAEWLGVDFDGGNCICWWIPNGRNPIGNPELNYSILVVFFYPKFWEKWSWYCWLFRYPKQPPGMYKTM